MAENHGLYKSRSRTRGAVLRKSTLAESQQSAVPTCSLSEAAVEVSGTDPSAIFHGQSQVHLDEALRQHPAELGFQAVKVTTTVRIYELENVILDGSTALLWQDGRKIADTDYFVPNGMGAAPGLHAADPVRLDDSHDFIIGYNNVHSGYQHWLTQCVPALDWSLRQPRKRPVRLVLPELAPWQEDILEILGYRSLPRLRPRPGLRYLLPHASYSTFLNGSTSFGICPGLTATARRILDALPPQSSPRGVVYVPCANPYYGAIENAAEIIALLQRHDVHIFDQRQHGTAERIKLFRAARAVIGPLGSGLTDILFCQPGSLLWEWMPRHHQNASYNRLAQASQVDYWGSLFETAGEPVPPAPWRVDPDAIEPRLIEILDRVGKPPARISRRAVADEPAGKIPIDGLMNAFENLGDNCEFGLVQRHCGIEPASLLRFAGIEVPGERRMEKMVAALRQRFAGLGAANTISVEPVGEQSAGEYITRESVYNLMSHSFVKTDQVDRRDLLLLEAKRMKFFRMKLLSDLAVGRRIWIWKSPATPELGQVEPLLQVLRAMGPNQLPWVVEADSARRAGSVEKLGDDFVKGYVRQFAPYDDAGAIDHLSWLEVCQHAYDLLANKRGRFVVKTPARARRVMTVAAAD